MQISGLPKMRHYVGFLHIRSHIISCTLQVAAILHSDAMKISSLYIKLMKDKTLTVLQGLIEHLPQAMIEFAHAANLSVTTKVCRYIVECTVISVAVMFSNVIPVAVV